MDNLLVLLLCAMTLLEIVCGRARLIEPPMRSSIWRYNIYNVPKNLMDDHLNCGGFEYQWKVANGRCGSCGDPFFGPSNNVYPGIFANNVMTRTVTQGSLLNVSVFVDQNQLGYFQFYLCPNMNGQEFIDLDECFDKHPLQILDTFSSTYFVGSGGGLLNMQLILPVNVFCQHCVLKWAYVTGYREGRDLHSCRTCLGCGPQETFINCADFTIVATQNQQVTPSLSTATRFPVNATIKSSGAATTESPTQSTAKPFKSKLDLIGSANQPTGTISSASGIYPELTGTIPHIRDTTKLTGPKIFFSGTLTGDASGVTEGSNAISIKMDTLIENASNLTNDSQTSYLDTPHSNSTLRPQPGENNTVAAEADLTTITEIGETAFVTPAPHTTTSKHVSSLQTNEHAFKTSQRLPLSDVFMGKRSFPALMLDRRNPKKNISVTYANPEPIRENSMKSPDTYFKENGLFEPIVPVYRHEILSQYTNNSLNTVPHTTTPAVTSVISSIRVNVKIEYCYSNSTYLQCESKTKSILWCLEQCYNSSCPKADCSCYCLMLDDKKYPISPNPITVIQRLSVYSHRDHSKKLCYLPRPRWQNVTGLSVWCKTNCPGLRCYGLCIPQPCR